jgi:CBS domain-containing protein
MTAGDLMSRELLVIPQAMSLRTAARLLAHARVTGAPVVDAHGRCIGVVSATDFLRWAGQPEGPANEPRSSCVCAWQIIESADLPEHQVGELMTADPVTITPTTPITDLARKMLDAHIHRVIVLDDKGHPIGIVSSTDILAAVAYANPAKDLQPVTASRPG